MLLVTDLERGGTPLRIARLAVSLAAAGVEVHTGCLAPRGPVSAQLEHDGIATFACDARDPRDLGTLRRLAAAVRRIRPDLIHSTLTHANVAARLVGWRTGVPVVGATATIELERRWHALAERWTVPLERAHIVNSMAVLEHVLRTFRLPRTRIHLVPPSVMTPPRMHRETARDALGIAPHEFVVVWAGRLDPVKRLDLLVGAAESMNTPDCRFLLAGEGPDRTRLEALLARSAAAPRVTLLGWQADLGRLFSVADAFAFPSRTEGMPNALLEALAFGLPAVASDIPSCRELAGDGRHLWLVSGDEPLAWGAAIRALRADDAARQALATRAAAWARANLSPAASRDAALRIYQGVISP